MQTFQAFNLMKQENVPPAQEYNLDFQDNQEFASNNMFATR